MFGGQQEDGSDYLSQAQNITQGYEFGSMRRQPWHPSGTRSFVVGIAAGIFLGSKMARKESRGTDSGGPQGCF